MIRALNSIPIHKIETTTCVRAALNEISNDFINTIAYRSRKPQNLHMGISLIIDLTSVTLFALFNILYFQVASLVWTLSMMKLRSRMNYQSRGNHKHKFC
jgi:hypothetical protein